jgi:hypothetical protein
MFVAHLVVSEADIPARPQMAEQRRSERLTIRPVIVTVALGVEHVPLVWKRQSVEKRRTRH